jgi:hypothetical protein
MPTADEPLRALALCGVLIGLGGCTKPFDPYYLVTGERLVCDAIHSDICILNRPESGEGDLENTIMFAEQHKDHPSLKIYQIEFAAADYIRVVVASFNYDFKTRCRLWVQAEDDTAV